MVTPEVGTGGGSLEAVLSVEVLSVKVPTCCRASQQALEGYVGQKISSRCLVRLLGETKHTHRAVSGRKQNISLACQAQ